MKNDDNTLKTNSYKKEVLYIEMIQHQMATFIDIDNLLKSRSKDMLATKHQTV
jgi:hypothetical protein